MAQTIPVTQITAALKIASTMDIKGMIKAFESADVATKVIEGEIAVDDALKIAGLFFPPLAVAANDLEIAIAVEEFALPVIGWLAKQPVVTGFFQKFAAGWNSVVGGSLPALRL